MSYSSSEQSAAFDKFVSVVETAWSDWENSFGPVELLSLRDMEAEEQQSRLDQVGEQFVWADVEYVEGSQDYELIPGVFASWNGWAVVPVGTYTDPNGEDFWISSKPWDSQVSYEPVFKFAQCVCPFCEGEGLYEDEDCETCEGSGEWEVDV
jgi:hypothetical protein